MRTLLLAASVVISLMTICVRGQEAINSTTTEAVLNKTVVVNKCCELNEILVESHPGARGCRKRSDLLHIDLRLARSGWEPGFHDVNTGQVVLGPRSYVIKFGPPKCKSTDVMFAVSHSPRTDDEIMLLSNGTLAHRLVHEEIQETSERIMYPPGR